MVLKIIFWIILFLILHSYVLYPLLMLILNTLVKKEKSSLAVHTPFVSVLMSVHNEELVLKEKIEALFASDYPPDKLEVLTGSDASDDNTNLILDDLRKVYPGLQVYSFPERTGKPSVINYLAERARGELLVITDANVIPTNSAISKLAGNFSDNRVGLADSRPVNTRFLRDGISVPEGAYLSFESKLKFIEGKIWGTMMGPFGGFYAVRKRSYLPNRNNTLADDFRICMNVLKNGEKAISDSEAIVYEDVLNDISDEFRRKTRISAGNFQNLVHFRKLLLNPFSRISFCFISHKALRWVIPVLWIALVILNVLLAGCGFLYQLLLILQVIFIILPPLDMLLRRIGINVVPLRYFTHLFFMNAALFAGLISYLGGIRSGAWVPTKREKR